MIGMRKWGWVSIGFLATVAGCVEPGGDKLSRLEKGLVVLLPGVDGTHRQFGRVVQGLHDAGLDRAVEIIEWGIRPFGTFENLSNVARNRQDAGRIARRICDYAREQPVRPVTLVGYSGGGGLAPMVVEALDAGVILDRLILCAPALSPEFDLRPTLSRTRAGIVNFYSPKDWFILGWGTRTFGTMDRVNTDSAGRFGFLDEQGRLRELPGLTQIPYDPMWFWLGHDGGHTGVLSRWWARDVLAPQIDPDIHRRSLSSCAR